MAPKIYPTMKTPENQLKTKSHQLTFFLFLIISSDWGHAKDFVEAMWHMLQLEKPEDFVIATGHMHSVREFVEKSFAFIGKEIVWEGKGKLSAEIFFILSQLSTRSFRQMLCGSLIRI